MTLMEMNVTGRPVDRIDGAAKVTGAATYAAEFRPQHVLYAVAINARVPKGTLRSVADAAARAVLGVIEVITPFNAPKLSRATVSPYTDEDALHGITDLSPPNYVLQDREVIHYGQEIGVVLAETFEAARFAATLVRFEYEVESAKLGLESHLDEAFTPQQLLIPVPPEYERGDVAKGLAEADVTLDATYETPVGQHCAMESNAAIAEWRGDHVVVHTSTQNVFSVQKSVANSFSVPLERVQVICPYVGGGFGSKVGTWEGRFLVGYGVATATYPAWRVKSAARLTLRQDGSLLVETAATDIGTGTYTILAQIAADATGVPLERVEVRLGDTNLPKTPGSGGSWGAHSFGTAVLEAGEALKADALRLVRDDGSPLHRLSNQEIRAADGRLFVADDPKRGETYVDILRRAGVPQLSSTVEAQPDGANNRFAIHGFGAQFCEVRVDPDTCEIRVPRFLGVYGVGKLLNPKTARSQLIGGITWGLGMALMEACALDRRYGHFVNDDLAEYHVPVNADIRDVEVVTLDETEDKLSRLGGKGLGEIGIVGVAAAVANAVYHATGVRVRKLPITLADLIHEGVGW
jgi:CO/xanthine dehydrogenase Mo-binding subunit